MRFLVDAQLPPVLTGFFSSRGVEAVHVQDVLELSASDSRIWEFAKHKGYCVVTKDEDFVIRAKQADTSPIVLWLRIGNSSNRALIQWLEPRWAGIYKRLKEGERIIEVPR